MPKFTRELVEEIDRRLQEYGKEHPEFWNVTSNEKNQRRLEIRKELETEKTQSKEGEKQE